MSGGTGEKAPPKIRLPKLPDRKTVKMTIVLPAEIAARLVAYAAAYCAQYGVDEQTSTLVPYMLDEFMRAERKFVRTRR